MAVPKKNIEDFFNPRVVDKEKYISEDINYLKDIINKKAGVIDMMSPGPLKDELRGTYDPTQESYEEFLQRQSIPQMDRPLTGQAPSDAILETQRIDLNEGGVLGPEGMFRGEDLGTREGFGSLELRKHLKTLKPETELNVKKLSEQFNASRKNASKIIKEEFPNLTILSKEEASRKMQQERLEKRKTQAPEFPTPISKRKRGQKTAEYYDVLWPNKEIKQSYIKDFTSKTETTKGYAPEGLSNEALAKKYFGEATEGTLAKVYRINSVLAKDKNLKYKTAETESQGKIKRKRRLDIVQGGKYFGGTEKFPFHHIMPIGGEVEITTKDVSFISKKMNSKLAPYNKKLNDIADAISNNLNNQQPGYLKRIDQLNKQAEQIIDKTKKELPKKYRGYIGFSKLEPIFDEYGTPIRMNTVRVGVDDAKSLAGKTGEKVPLSKLTPKQLKKIASGPVLGMNLGLGKKLLTALQVLGTPAAALAFAGSEIKRGLDEGKTPFEATTDPNVGLSLLAPGVASRLNPGLLKGVLGLGKAARFFTPTGLALLTAGQAKDFYDQYQNLQALKETDPQAYEAFMSQRVSEEISPEQQTEIEEMGREGAMKGGIMRLGFKGGPKDPSKRKFIKVGAGILGALPFGVTKLFKSPTVQKGMEAAAPAAEAGWSWIKNNFWEVVGTVKNKAKTFAKLKDGEVRIHKDMEVIENPETIRVRYKTDNDNMAETVYTKPYKEVNPETGEIIDIPGDFQEYQDVYRLGNKEVYKDFEEEIIDSVENVKKIIKEN
jgi:hypothetical protein